VTVLASSSTSLFDQPGTLGFLVIFGMGIVLYFVFRSMARHLRKVNNAAREEAAAAFSAEQAEQAGHADQTGQAAQAATGARAEDQHSR
jgi:hypothetical protein